MSEFGDQLVMLAGAGRLQELKDRLSHPERNVDSLSRRGETALMEAAFKGQLSVVQWLVGMKANINSQDAVFRGSSLFWASSAGHLDVVKYLVGCGCDLELQNSDGCTAVMDAALGRHFSVVEFLIGAGALLSHRRNDGASIWSFDLDSGDLDEAIAKGLATLQSTWRAARTAFCHAVHAQAFSALTSSPVYDRHVIGCVLDMLNPACDRDWHQWIRTRWSMRARMCQLTQQTGKLLSEEHVLHLLRKEHSSASAPSSGHADSDSEAGEFTCTSRVLASKRVRSSIKAGDSSSHDSDSEADSKFDGSASGSEVSESETGALKRCRVLRFVPSTSDSDDSSQTDSDANDGHDADGNGIVDDGDNDNDSDEATDMQLIRINGQPLLVPRDLSAEHLERLAQQFVQDPGAYEADL